MGVKCVSGAIAIQAEKYFGELDQVGPGLAGAEFVEGRGRNWGNIERRTLNIERRRLGKAREDGPGGRRRPTSVWRFDNGSRARCVVLHAMRLPVRGGHLLSKAIYFENFGPKR
jgi:hypothetical protein